MNQQIKDQIIFALEDDNELMTAALNPDSGLDAENKQMNRELIREHERIIGKVEKSKQLTPYDLQLIADANEIHRNDVDNLGGHHQEAVRLDRWLAKKMEVK